jgi:hypothetical protein
MERERKRKLERVCVLESKRMMERVRKDERG